MTREDIIRMALEALEEYSPIPTDGPWHKRHHKAITALRAALAEEAMQRLTDVQQEMERKPVAYLTGYSKGYATVQLVDPCWLMCVGMALYRSPYKYKPLTDEEIEQLMKWPEKGTDLLEFARAIERAHGIGSEE